MRIHHARETTERLGEETMGRGAQLCGGRQSHLYDLRDTMDLFQHPYYRMNKILLMLIGQWPYQTTCVRRGILAVIIVGGSSLLVPQIAAVVKNHDDWDSLLISASPFVFEVSLVVRMVSTICNMKNILKLLNRIRMDWQVWGRDRAVNIIHEYAEQGRKSTNMYAVMVLSTCVLFTTQPVMLKIIDIFVINGSELGEFAIPVDYYNLDTQKYYFYISTHAIVCVTVGGIIIVAINTMFIVCVQHGCGLFDAVGNKLQLTGQNEKPTDTVETTEALTKKQMDFDHIVSCINHHNNAIEFAKLINATYSWSFFFFVGCNVLMTSITGYQILTTANEPLKNARFIAFLITNTVHLYVETNMSQNLMDHSIHIRYCIYNNQWYTLSPAAKKLLVFMAVRCNVPCKMVAGKILTISIENFMTILRTSLSYFTLLRSM